MLSIYVYQRWLIGSCRTIVWICHFLPPWLVHAPWLKTAFYADYDTYILPGFNGTVTLGGTRQYESYNMQIDKYDAMSIRERCESLVPSLANANVVRQAVGLRPYRSSVRVECELIKDVHGNWLRCIHHYGHGGYGVTSSPGRLGKNSFTVLSYLLRIINSFISTFHLGTAAYAVQLLQMARQSRAKL